MHVNQVRLAEKTDSISWEEQPSEWTAADTGSNEIENMIHQIQDFGRIAAADGENSKALRQMLMTRQGYLKKVQLFSLTNRVCVNCRWLFVRMEQDIRLRSRSARKERFCR